MKYSVLFFFLFYGLGIFFNLSAQEVTHIEIIDSDLQRLKPFQSSRLLMDNGRYYKYHIRIRDTMDKYYGVNLTEWYADTYEFDVNSSSLLMEYIPGQGFSDDYTVFDGVSDLEALDIDGDNIVFNARVNWFAVDGQVMHSRDPLDLYTHVDNIYIYDTVRDSLLWKFTDVDSSRVQDREYLLDGDYLYMGIQINEPFIFLGDTIDHQFPDFGSQMSNVLIKVNWRTNTIEWKRYTGTFVYEDDIYGLEKLPDGNIEYIVRINAPMIWQLEVLDPDYYFSNNVRYNIGVVKVSPDGDLITNGTFFNKWDYPATLISHNSDGNLYLHSGEGYEVTEYLGDTIYTNINADKRGVAIKIDSELNFQWVHSIPNTYCTTANSTTNDYSIVAMTLESGDSTLVDGEYYVNVQGSEDPNTGRHLIYKLNNEGEVEGDPIIFGNKSSVSQVLTLGKNHYLICLLGSPVLNMPELLGTVVSLEGKYYISFIEVKGDLFSALTSISELENDSYCIRIFPNPVKDKCTIDMPESWLGTNCVLRVFDMSGKCVKFKDQIVEREYITIDMEGMKIGSYIVQLTNEISICNQLLIKN